MSYSKTRSDEQRYIQDAYQDIEMTEASEEDEESGDEQEADEVSEPETRDPEPVSSPARFPGNKSGKNQHLTVGYKDDLSFVTRGDTIGVFVPKDDQLVFRTSIDRIKDTQGRTFSPHKVMLHHQDGDMLLLNPENPHSVYRMDLEVGKVVDEWGISDELDISNIIPA